MRARRPVGALLLVLACLAGACGRRADVTSPVLVAEPAALNETLRVALPRAVDPTSVTPRSVSLRDADGRELAWRASCRGRELQLEVALDADALAAASRGWTLRLAGFPSPHALRWLDGGTLPAAWSTPVTPAPRLEPGSAAAPRLLLPDGGAPGAELRVPEGASLELLLDGVFAPATLRAEQFPLHPTRGGLQLEALFPEPRARVVGARTELRLALPPTNTELLLRTRDWTATDVAGRRLDPSVVIRLSTH